MGKPIGRVGLWRQICWLGSARPAASHLRLALLLTLGLSLDVWRTDLRWTANRSLLFAGLVLCVSCLLVARYQMGQAFTPKIRANCLVTRGFYRRFQHPIYLFGALALLLYALWKQSIAIGGLLLITVPLQLYRARLESQALARRFGASYRLWKSSTWF